MQIRLDQNPEKKETIKEECNGKAIAGNGSYHTIPEQIILGQSWVIEDQGNLIVLS